MSTEISICTECKHYREKKMVNPFSSNIHLWTPDILKAKTQWEKEQNETAMIEQQRFEAEEEFDYEPNYFPWCEKWTQEEDRYAIDPVSGKKSRIYILCARANSDGQCPFFEKT